MKRDVRGLRTKEDEVEDGLRYLTDNGSLRGRGKGRMTVYNV